MPALTAALPLLGLLAFVQPAFAAPPSDAKPLSEILKMLEDGGDVAYFEEIEWDDDHWDIDYVRIGGEEVEIEVDPVSGQPRG